MTEYRVEKIGSNTDTNSKLTLDKQGERGLSERTKQNGGWVTIYIKPVGSERSTEDPSPLVDVLADYAGAPE